MKTYIIDDRLVHLFEKLATFNPPVGEMIAALNIALKPSEQKIETRQDFECFIDQIDNID
ncbi:hypothetical protein MID13_23765 (plasmid) [Vibrio gigantis]|uniref:hypothetical protein n=1 Tax=Vibrio gigantis TaxID=296199 RepID=UPI001EFA4510|nr:hypothetical protein [Vibrio gigantis]ULN67389.1 hypothetical protein MID13_23765 [Vibrio gigantis]